MNEIQQLIADLELLVEGADLENQAEAKERLNKQLVEDTAFAREVVQQLELDALLVNHFGAPPALVASDANYKSETLASPPIKSAPEKSTIPWSWVLGVAASLFVGVGLFWFVQQFPTANEAVTQRSAESKKSDTFDSAKKKSVLDSKSEPDRQLVIPWEVSYPGQETKTIQGETLSLDAGEVFLNGRGSQLRVTTPVGQLISANAQVELRTLPEGELQTEKITDVVVRVIRGQVTLTNDSGQLVVVQGESATMRRKQAPIRIE